MPITPPANTQQVLQMSSAVEKIQAQQMVHLAGDQLQDEERERLDELKRLELQDPDQSNPLERANPEGGNRKRRLRFKKPAKSADKDQQDTSASTSASPPIPEGNQGSNLDVVV